MAELSTNKTIAKNTLMLYFRTMVIMIVSLYTSRVILQTLGIDDFGLYQAVGGIVGFMSFLNSALSTGSSRFLTFALGKGDKHELRNTFSTVLIVHIALAILVIIVGESVGLWFLNNKLVIPGDRLFAAKWVFHLSIITAAINITQVPFSGCITAHERFNLYAYTSIVESILKLIIVYMLNLADLDKLILYATLLLCLQASLQFFYRWYCLSRFEECKFKMVFDKGIFKPIAKFSGWSLFANVTIALNSQGILILLNLFFSPAVVAARAISLQVDGVVKQFVNNFKTASNPSIIKKYASGDLEGSKSLLIQTSNWAFFLMTTVCAPVCVCAAPLLHLWLTEVPEYTVPFLQIIMFQSLFSVFDSCFYQAFNASGRLRENALVSPTINLARFVIIFFCFKNRASPLALSYAGVGTNFLISCIAKPYLMVKYLNYKWYDFLPVVKSFIRVGIPVIALSACSILCTGPSNYPYFRQLLIKFPIALLITLVIVWYLGFSKSERTQLMTFVRTRIFHKK